jgi:hypothetical protein
MSGKSCVKSVCGKGALVVAALLIVAFSSYAYISWFVLPYLFAGYAQTDYTPGHKGHFYGIFLLLLHTLLIVMLSWSLVKTWWSNPGFVGEYFKSVVVKETTVSQQTHANDG